MSVRWRGTPGARSRAELLEGRHPPWWWWLASVEFRELLVSARERCPNHIAVRCDLPELLSGRGIVLNTSTRPQHRVRSIRAAQWTWQRSVERALTKFFNSKMVKTVCGLCGLCPALRPFLSDPSLLHQIIWIAVQSIYNVLYEPSSVCPHLFGY